MSKKKIVFNIVLSIFFIWCLIGAIIVFPPAILAVIVIYLFILLFPKNKEDIRNQGKMVRGVVEYFGTMAEEAGKTGAALTYYGGIVIKGTVEEFYKRIGGEAGAKKILDTLGKFGVEAGKIIVEASIVTGKVIASVTEYTMERIEQEKRRKLNKSERDLIDDFVDWEIIKDGE